MDAGATPNLSRTAASSTVCFLRRSRPTTLLPRTIWARSLSGEHITTWSTPGESAHLAARGGDGVVGLELDHGPHHQAERGGGALREVELRQHVGGRVLAGLVAVEQIVAERGYDVVEGDGDVAHVVLSQQHQQGLDKPSDRRDRAAVRRVLRGHAEVRAEQLVGAVYQVQLHGRTQLSAPIVAKLPKGQ